MDDGWRWWRVGQIDRACVEFSAAARCFLPSSAAVKNMRAATLKTSYIYIFPRRKKDGRKNVEERMWQEQKGLDQMPRMERASVRYRHCYELWARVKL